MSGSVEHNKSMTCFEIDANPHEYDGGLPKHLHNSKCDSSPAAPMADVDETVENESNLDGEYIIVPFQHAELQQSNDNTSDSNAQQSTLKTSTKDADSVHNDGIPTDENTRYVSPSSMSKDNQHAKSVLESSPDPPPGWVKEWTDDDFLTFRHVESGFIAWTYKQLCARVEFLNAPLGPDPWIKLYSHSRSKVVYHNTVSKEIFTSWNELRAKLEMDKAPDTPQGFEDVWEKVWDEQRECVVYHNNSTNSTVQNIEDIRIETMALHEASITMTPPSDRWTFRYSHTLGAVYYHNIDTGTNVRDSFNMHCADALEDALDPPAPWKKVLTMHKVPDVSKVENSGMQFMPMQNNSRATDSGAHGDVNFFESGLVTLNDEPDGILDVVYVNDETNQIVEDIMAVECANAIAAAPVAGPDWDITWMTSRGAVVYAHRERSKLCNTIAEVRAYEAQIAAELEQQQAAVLAAEQKRAALAAARSSLVPGWDTAWSDPDARVYYFHAASQDTVWKADDMHARDAERDAPDVPSIHWEKKWNKSLLCVEYHHKTSQQILPCDYDTALRTDAMLAAPAVPHAKWQKVWSASAERPVYRRVDRQELLSQKDLWDQIDTNVWYHLKITEDFSIDEAQRFDCVLSAPPPPAVGWRKEYSEQRDKVIYRFDISLYTERTATADGVCASSTTLPHEAETIAQVSIAHAVFTAPEPGSPWEKKWSTMFGRVMYVNPDTGVIVDSFEKVHVADALASATNLGTDWIAFWCAEEGTVCYRHRVSDVVVQRKAEAVSEEKRLALLYADEPPEELSDNTGYNWQKQFDEASRTVNYVDSIRGIVVPSIAAIHVVVQVDPQRPASPWVLIWDAASNRPVYKHTVKHTVVKTYFEVHMYNVLAAMPAPGKGWVRTWDIDTQGGIYVRSSEPLPADVVFDPNYVFKSTASTLAEVQHSNAQLALAMAPAVAPPWKKWYSEVQERVYFYKTSDARHIWDFDEVLHQMEVDALAQMPDAPAPWTKRWDSIRRIGVYAAPLELITFTKLEDVLVEVAPDANLSNGWCKEWDPTGERVVYQHKRRGIVATSYSAALVADARAPSAAWKRVWNDTTETVDYTNRYTGTTVASWEETVKADKMRDAPVPPQEWTKMWSEHRNCVVYRRALGTEEAFVYNRSMRQKNPRRRGNDRFTAVATSIEAAKAVDAILTAPAAGPCWVPVWDDFLKQVVYTHSDGEKALDVAATIAYDKIQLLMAAPQPSKYWKRVYDDTLRQVVYKNRDTAVVVHSHAETVVIDDERAASEAVTAAPDPPAGRGWVKEWGFEQRKVIYTNALLHCTVTTMADVLKFTALAEAPDAGPQWTTLWDEVKQILFYHHKQTGESVYSLSETKSISSRYYQGNVNDDRQFWQSKGKAGEDPARMVFTVRRASTEYKTVSSYFLRTMAESARITKIERVENGFQRKTFVAQVENIRAQVGSDYLPRTMRRHLFHGAPIQAMEMIINGMDAGFAPLLAGTRVGKIFGDGVYLARDASYSHAYAAKISGTACYQMLVVDAIVGYYTVGTEGMTCPLRTQYQRYNSLVDKIVNPGIFVIPHANQAYPAYRISYILTG
eukprot:m.23729 g.23729  ORF g.23729 m.23729 type:complete len:1584 (+) comp12976_c0_seq1:405-5156(+)